MRRWIGLAALTLLPALLGLRAVSRVDGPTEPNVEHRVPGPARQTPSEAREDPATSACPRTVLAREVTSWNERDTPHVRSLEGRVRDALTGKPILGARVSCHEGSGPGWYNSTSVTLGALRSETSTTSDGRFELTVVPGRSILAVGAPGHGTVRRLLRRETGPQAVELVPAGTVRGRVSDAAGRPVANAKVMAALVLGWRTFGAPGHGSVRYAPRSYAFSALPAVEPVFSCEWTTTDEEGQYSLDRLAGGQEYSVRAQADGFVDPGPRRHLSLRPGESRALDLRLARPETREVNASGEESAANARDVVHGRIEKPHDETRRPGAPETRPATIRMTLIFPPPASPPARVPVRIRGPGCSVRTTGDLENGRLVMELHARSESLTLRPPGLLEQTIPLDLRPGEDRILPPVRFARGASIDIRVRGPDGDPIADATVSTGGIPRSMCWSGQKATTDASGLATLHGLRSGEATRICISADGFVIERRDLEPGRIEVALRRLGVLRGRFLDEAGLPIGHLEVIAHPRREDDEKTYGTHGEADNAGRFDLSAPPGRYRLEVRRPGALNGDGATYLEVEIRPDGNPPLRLQIPR